LSFLLDTNIISEVRKGGDCDPGVAAWYATIQVDEIFLSALVIGEIRKGVELLSRRDVLKAKRLDRWLVQVTQAFEGRILPVDGLVAEEWGKMSAIRTVPVIDGLIAATAKVRGLTLATRNVADVEGLGVKLLNPFQR
jgi:predicted nucleic acid-binding protein